MSTGSYIILFFVVGAIGLPLAGFISKWVAALSVAGLWRLLQPESFATYMELNANPHLQSVAPRFIPLWIKLVSTLINLPVFVCLTFYFIRFAKYLLS